MRVFGDQVDARRELDLDRTDAPGRKVRTKNVEDIKQVEVNEQLSVQRPEVGCSVSVLATVHSNVQPRDNQVVVGNPKSITGWRWLPPQH